MLCLLIFFLLLIVPGFISALVYKLISGHRITNSCIMIISGLIFNLLILIINLAGLYIFKAICTFEELKCYFNCLSFTARYGILSIIVGIVLAIIAAIIFRLCVWKKHCGCKDKNVCRDKKS
jgi:hypothetical protein